MPTKTIYVACHNDEIEGAFMIKGFESEKRAQDFCEVLTEYAEKYPPSPNTLSETPGCWEEWNRKFVEWRDNHPGGDKCVTPADEYIVLHLEVEY